MNECPEGGADNARVVSKGKGLRMWPVAGLTISAGHTYGWSLWAVGALLPSLTFSFSSSTALGEEQMGKITVFSNALQVFFLWGEGGRVRVILSVVMTSTRDLWMGGGQRERVEGWKWFPPGVCYLWRVPVTVLTAAGARVEFACHAL